MLGATWVASPLAACGWMDLLFVLGVVRVKPPETGDAQWVASPLAAWVEEACCLFWASLGSLFFWGDFFW